MPSNRQKKDRIFLTDEERTILRSLLPEWNGKGNKKSRDAFVSSEAIPQIQQLNLDQYGPEVVSRDKPAKVLWEKRMQVCIFLYPSDDILPIKLHKAVYTWFRNNKPYKDRQVFRMERKVPLRRVVGSERSEEIHELVSKKHPEAKRGETKYPGYFQKALTDYMAGLSPAELEELEQTRAEWQAQGPPIDQKLK